MSSSKDLDWISPLEVSEGSTQKISNIYSYMGDNLILKEGKITRKSTATWWVDRFVDSTVD